MPLHFNPDDPIEMDRAVGAMLQMQVRESEQGTANHDHQRGIDYVYDNVDAFNAVFGEGAFGWAASVVCLPADKR